MTFDEFLKIDRASRHDIIVYATEEKALEVVKKDGYALFYLKEQTEVVNAKTK